MNGSRLAVSELFRNRQTIPYKLVEPTLRSGDVVFYNYNGNPQNMQATSLSPHVEKRLAAASVLSQLCGALPCLACMLDDRETDEQRSPRSLPSNEVDAAETRMEHSWHGWQHATVIVVLRDETRESNPLGDESKTLPYTFVPTDKHRLDLVPLRSLIVQSRTSSFGVRHLLINSTESKPLLPAPPVGALPAQSLAAAAAAAADTATLKAFSSGTRSFVHDSIVELYKEIWKLVNGSDVTPIVKQGQMINLLLREPAAVNVDSSGCLSLRSVAVTASHEYLVEVASLSHAKDASDLKTTPTTRAAPLEKLLPLFATSPSYLALFALYNARVSLLVPRSGHTASHLRDTGAIDRFLAGGFSLSDEIGVEFCSK